MSPRARTALANVPNYVPGGATAGMTKLSSNENPFDPLPGVLDEAATALRGMNRYPDLACTALTEALSEVLTVATDRIVIGTGSSAILQQIATAMAAPGDEFVFPWRSFESYPIVTLTAGARPVAVPLTDHHEVDLDAMQAAITPRTRVVFICTPNNPTGTTVLEQDMARFLAMTRKDILVVIDEAYAEYVRDPRATAGVALARKHPNVCALRTFSKAYGLAGLRVGYAVASTEIAAALRKCAVPFGVCAVAQRAALVSLRLASELLQRVETTVRERTRMRDHLVAGGISVPRSEGNFVWLPLGARATSFAEACQRSGLLVRAFAGEGVRVTVSSCQANDALLRAADEWLASPVDHARHNSGGRKRATR